VETPLAVRLGLGFKSPHKESLAQCYVNTGIYFQLMPCLQNTAVNKISGRIFIANMFPNEQIL
jgi:hypothetical protein